MRILHTADWHLGKKSEGRDRLPEQKKALEAMVSLCEAQKVDFVAVAGDVFDTYTPSAEAEDLFYLALTELSAGGRRAVFVIAGNHDDPTRLAAARELGYRHNVFLIEHPGQVLRQEQDFALRLKDSAPGSALFQKGEEALAVGFLPYPSEERMGLPLEKELSYSEKVRRWFTPVHFGKGGFDLALSHLFLAGSMKAGTEREIEAGGLKAAGVEVFASAHYAALGHIHRFQRLKNAAYSGSLLKYAFDEADPKGALLVEGDQKGLYSLEFCPLPGRDFVRLEAQDLAEAREKLAALPEAYTELTLRLNQPLTFPEVRELRRAFPDLLQLKIVLPERAGQAVSRKELSPEKLFSAFYEREYQKPPQPELLQLFTEKLEQARKAD